MNPDDDITVEPERKKIYDQDEALAETALGHLTSEESLEDDEDGEVDAMVKAAGLPRGGAVDNLINAPEKRDDERYELDPDSAEDREERINRT